MAYEKLSDAALDYDLCHYPGSKLLFRGPQRPVDGDYLAFLGGTETYGKFIADPYVNQVETELGLPCVNLGCSNAGVDVFLHEDGVLTLARSARAVVLQLPGAHNMSNRFYAVHPRRNDRFVKPTAMMQQVFPEIDFSEFHFTRHLLGRLQHRAPKRFATLRQELQTAWIARIKLLLGKFDQDVILLWLSKRRPSQDNDSPDVSRDPALVTRPMIEAIRSYATDVVEVCERPHTAEMDAQGMICSPVEHSAARELLGPVAHSDAAAALCPILRNSLT